MVKARKQMWVLAGGNGAGKSTFYRLFLEGRGIKLVNADLLAREINPEHPEQAGYQASNWVGRLLADLLDEGVSFCFETVFSHPSKVDLVARAKAHGYQVILIFIHLDDSGLNEARVRQRVGEGGHDVPADKIRSRVSRCPRLAACALPLADEAYLLDNSSHDDPFRLVAVIRGGKRVAVGVTPGGKANSGAPSAFLPGWAAEMTKNCR